MAKAPEAFTKSGARLPWQFLSWQTSKKSIGFWSIYRGTHNIHKYTQYISKKIQMTCKWHFFKSRSPYFPHIFPLKCFSWCSMNLSAWPVLEDMEPSLPTWLSREGSIGRGLAAGDLSLSWNENIHWWKLQEISLKSLDQGMVLCFFRNL